MIPVLTRPVRVVTSEPERLELSDGDFLDLSWSGKSQERLAILSHGLEGNSEAGYIQQMASCLMTIGWDVLAWNFRGCSGEPNRQLHFYHSGATDDLAFVIQHALKQHPARDVALIGFSLGGNLTLKYLGEPRSRPPQLSCGIAFSVPCDLSDSAHQLSRLSNRVYMRRFLTSLREKLRQKDRIFPGELDLKELNQISDFLQFDDRFTAPLHGFRNAEDYWKQSSCRQFLPNIQIPTLLVNALNDPFLGEMCYPFDEAQKSHEFWLETPPEGGHVTFPTTGGSWAPKRAITFLQQLAAKIGD